MKRLLVSSLLAAAGLWVWTWAGGMPDGNVDPALGRHHKGPAQQVGFAPGPDQRSASSTIALAARPTSTLVGSGGTEVAELPSSQPPSDQSAAPSHADLWAAAARAERQQAATARFSSGVRQLGATARDIDPAIREMFNTMELEPVAVRDGYIDGLRIVRLPADHPLAQAGFGVGDRITRLDDVPLRDPAEVPKLLLRLKQGFELCVASVDNPSTERCRGVSLVL